MSNLILYGTLGCHLCDEAEALLLPLVSAQCSIEYIDISESDQLIEQYGTFIPVLCRVCDGAELHWPFDDVQACEFLSGV